MTKKNQEQTSGPDDEGGEMDPEISDEELAEAAAAVALATLPQDELMPAHVRERVEVAAKAYLGNRAKVHARERAADADRLAAMGEPHGPPRMQSTTSAGSHVVAPFDETPRARPTSLLAWSGWGLAAAAVIALLAGRLSRSPSSASAGADGAFAPSTEERLVLRGAGDVAGELRHDRARGTATVKLTRAPRLDADRESLQLWVVFEGDTAPRPLALLDANGETTLGMGQPLCQGSPSAELPAPRCVALREAVVTLEERRGTVVFREDHAVMRGKRSP